MTSLFSSYFFAFITFGDVFFMSQDNKASEKQAPGHNHENTIFQPRKCPFYLNAISLFILDLRSEYVIYLVTADK